ncbi:uncharacterized protein J3D65DRAFT_1684 [Phyllosticta citribraziliensis]|uniref:Uncharacterized protein n=1 Tax=Phyllosticta citribraziliensis TaxID=989973 RepID=A0ABR1MBP3_9PEZI
MGFFVVSIACVCRLRDRAACCGAQMVAEVVIGITTAFESRCNGGHLLPKRNCRCRRLLPRCKCSDERTLPWLLSAMKRKCGMSADKVNAKQGGELALSTETISRQLQTSQRVDIESCLPVIEEEYVGGGAVWTVRVSRRGWSRNTTGEIPTSNVATTRCRILLSYYGRRVRRRRCYVDRSGSKAEIVQEHHRRNTNFKRSNDSMLNSVFLLWKRVRRRRCYVDRSGSKAEMVQAHHR